MKDDELAIALARRIWEERDVLHWEDRRDQERSPSVPPTTLKLMDGTTLRISQTPWRVKVDMAGHRQDLEYYPATKVIRAWRAVQALGMLTEMGDIADPERVLLGEPGPLRRLALKMGRRLKADPLNVQHRLDAMLADRVEREVTRRIDATYRTADFDGNAYDAEVIWHDAGNDVMFIPRIRYGLDGSTRHLSVVHPNWGTVEIPSVRTDRALTDRRDRAHVGALSNQRVPVLPPPPRGNARIARIARLCRQALALDPDLTDGNGAPIRPLVEKHLPDLMRIHAEAAATAPAETLEDVDMQLERGVETIRRAVEEAVSLLHEKRRQDLATQLRFLEARHPTDISNWAGVGVSGETLRLKRDPVSNRGGDARHGHNQEHGG